MDEDGLELQPQEPNSYFDAAGITTGVVPLPHLPDLELVVKWKNC